MQILSDIVIHSASSLEILLPCVDDRSPLTQPWTITCSKRYRDRERTTAQSKGLSVKFLSQKFDKFS